MNVLRAILLIVRRSLRQHALSTAITALSVALGCGLLLAVFAIERQTYNAFTSGTTGFDAVLGPRGSKLQIVLNSVFHMEQSEGNVKWSTYQMVRQQPAVAEAIPLAVGDNYHDYRIVGTVPELFTKHEIREDETFAFESGGRVFDPLRAEAVVGSFVARKTGLRVGDTFHSYHGLTFERTKEHEHITFTVVGVLKPTSTPADRAIWIPLEAYYRMPDHALRGTGEPFKAKPGEAIPDEHKEVSAVLIKLRDKSAGEGLDWLINKQGDAATLAWPIAKTLADLFDKLGWAQRVLRIVAYLVIVVAAGSILASIYNSMNERRREFAILRALGARRSIVFGAIVAEAACIAAIGAVVGFAVYAALLALVAVIIRQQAGVVLEVMSFHPVFIAGPLGIIALGALAGVVPAIKAYSTDVAANLTPTS